MHNAKAVVVSFFIFTVPVSIYEWIDRVEGIAERGSNQRSSLPGFCPAVYCLGLTKQRYLSDQTRRLAAEP